MLHGVKAEPESAKLQNRWAYGKRWKKQIRSGSARLKERRAGMQCCTQQKERQLNATAEGGRNKTNQRTSACIGYGTVVGTHAGQATRACSCQSPPVHTIARWVGLVRGRKRMATGYGPFIHLEDCCCCLLLLLRAACCCCWCAAGALVGPAALCCLCSSEWVHLAVPTLAIAAAATPSVAAQRRLILQLSRRAAALLPR
jgi:hypothetical protein